jgi:UDP-sulfoquinovose synthase
MMRILVLGGDGYLGWPTAMYLSRRGHHVGVMDNFAKRGWELELNVEPLLPVHTLHDRVAAWEEVTREKIALFVGDLRNYGTIIETLQEFRPDAIVHYGEQPSAPFSMIDHDRSVFTQVNNVGGTLNLIWAMKTVSPKCHLVKLGTMGEYGTPNIDIEEGFIEIEHKGRRDILPFPCQPGSFYHLSKVHDSHNIRFACKIWKLAATDLHQGVVYGVDTDETQLDSRFATSFHYDEVFGTALNRFCVQAIAGIPLTVYGRGGQNRGFLNIRDTLRCVELAIINSAQGGEYRVFNQFTETFSVSALAELVVKQARKLGVWGTIEHSQNPRVELEEHYYNPMHSRLLELGLQPHFLSDVLVESMLLAIGKYKDRIKSEIIQPKVHWTGQAGDTEEQKKMVAGS